MTTHRRLAALEKRRHATDVAADRRAMLDAIGADTFDPRAWTDAQLEAALAWHRKRDPAGMAHIEGMTDDELEGAVTEAQS